MKTPKRYVSFTRREVVGTFEPTRDCEGAIRQMKIRFKSIRSFCKWVHEHRFRNVCIFQYKLDGKTYTARFNRDNVSKVLQSVNGEGWLLVKVDKDSWGWMYFVG